MAHTDLVLTLLVAVEKAKKKASGDKNKKSGIVINKHARVVEEDDLPKKKSSKKAAASTPKVSLDCIDFLLLTFSRPRWFLKSQRLRKPFRKDMQVAPVRVRSMLTPKPNLMLMTQ
jgi:hypothetical protein